MNGEDRVSLIKLTRQLLAVESVNRNESLVAEVVLPILSEAGFDITIVDLAPGRANVLASYNGGGDLVLSGHLDTVAFDPDLWQSDPLGGEIADGRIYGRGSSDMKGGVASLCLSAIRHVARTPHGRGFHLALTASEENGCRGASALARTGLLPKAPLLVIGESTSNELRLGHKGATWLEIATTGTSAHGSRPDLGVNAIDNLISGAELVKSAAPSVRHAALGDSTINIGTITGGTQTNMVPDRASMTVDVRTVPGFDIDAFEVAIEAGLLNGHLSRLLHLPPVWTSEREASSERMNALVTSVTGVRSPAAGTAYFTDAAILAADLGRTFVVGPGHPDQPHSVDEWCDLRVLEESGDVYDAILAAWDNGSLR